MAANRVPEGQYTETIYGMVREIRQRERGTINNVYTRCGFRSKKVNMLK